VFIYCFVRSVIKNLVANKQFRFSCAYAYAYVEHVTSENCTRQISGFVLLPGVVLPYMGYIDMCGPKGYGFSAVLVINWVSILAILPPFWS